MSAAHNPKGDHVRSDHQHVGKISTQTTMFVLIVVAVILYAIQWILLPFVISGLLAYICTRPIDGLAAHSRVPRALFAIAAFALIVAIFALLGYLGIPPLISELTHIAGDFQGTVQSLVQGAIGDRTVSVFGQSMNAKQVTDMVITTARDWIGHAENLFIAGSILFGSLFGVILTLVLLLYFLLSGPEIAKGLLWLVPPQQRPLIKHIWTCFDPVLRRYFIGVLLVVVYATSVAYIGLGFVLGIPHAVFLAILTGLLEMIPVIGPAASAIIAGLVAVRYATGIGPIVGYAIYATALRLSIDQMFGPLALGAAARVHPVLIMFCFLSGGVLFGISGVILAVPVALLTKTTLAILYDSPSGLPIPPEDRRASR
jgi:predicted PurR-regulated permease PerM